MDFKPVKHIKQGDIWRIIETTKFSGYWMVKTIPAHPRSLKACGRRPGGYVYLHIVLMENFLGRYLNKYEDVHHINFIKTDNRIKNLEIMNIIDHKLLHKERRERVQKRFKDNNMMSKIGYNVVHEKGKTMVEIECVICNSVFTMVKSLYTYNLRNRSPYYPICSKHCSRKYIKNKEEKYTNKGILREYKERA